MGVMARITHGVDSEHITAPDWEVVMRGGFIIDDWGDALTSEMVLTIPEMPLPTAGLYVVRIFVADCVLMERYIDVRTTPQSPAVQGD